MRPPAFLRKEEVDRRTTRGEKGGGLFKINDQGKCLWHKKTVRGRTAGEAEVEDIHKKKPVMKKGRTEM